MTPIYTQPLKLSDPNLTVRVARPTGNFYDAPRFVPHIDDGAIASVTQYYRDTLPPGADILDVCSSWVSHLPDELQLGRVVGLGMNALVAMRASTRAHPAAYH